MAHLVMVYIIMALGLPLRQETRAHIGMAYIVMAYIVMADPVMAHLVMADLVMAHLVMADLVMAYTVYGLYSYGAGITFSTRNEGPPNDGPSSSDSLPVVCPCASMHPCMCVDRRASCKHAGMHAWRACRDACIGFSQRPC